MVQGKWFPVGADLTAPLSVRLADFGRGRDALDDISQQVLALDDAERPVGTARLWWQDGAFWAGDVGVLPDARGMGYGDLLVRLLLFKALTHGAVRVCLTPTEETRGFFARYGFTPEDGHMAVRAEDIHLSHCGAGCDGCH